MIKNFNVHVNWKKTASIFLVSGLLLCPKQIKGEIIQSNIEISLPGKTTIIQQKYNNEHNISSPYSLVASSGRTSGGSQNVNNSMIQVVKVKKNNVNVRSGPSTRSEVIGFADITDRFEIIEKEGNWYKVHYLNTEGFIRSDMVREESIAKSDMTYIKIVYLTRESNFYSEANDNSQVLTTLPQYQNAFVISESNNFYRVMVDGVFGYIKKNNTKKLSNTCVIVDLPRQMLRVYKNNHEVGRYHIISGRKSMQTDIGCFTIGHRLRDYQLTPDNFVNVWIQYNGNEGIHDASWQKDRYFTENANSAYGNFGRGRGTTYPANHGSHGCDNMMLSDAMEVYNLVRVGDNVLVIGPNNLVRLHLISEMMQNYFEKYLQANEIIQRYIEEYHNSYILIQEEPIKIKKLV